MLIQIVIIFRWSLWMEHSGHMIGRREWAVWGFEHVDWDEDGVGFSEG